MAFAHITNLTVIPVRIWLGNDSGKRGERDLELTVLEPGDETTVKVPAGSELSFTDKLDRVAITIPVKIASAMQEIRVTEDAQLIRGSQSVSGRVTLLNTLDETVELTQLRKGPTTRIKPGQQLAINVKDGFRLRRPDKSNVDLILLDPNTPVKEDPPFRIVDRYALLRRLEEGDPNVRHGRYNILKQDLPAPDAGDTKYIRYGHQTLVSKGSTVKEFNGLARPVRAVTISGVDLVFDETDRLHFLADYQGAEDVAELWIHADTVTVKTEIRLPSTNVHIHCRVLRFEGRQACIVTTPIDKTFRDPLKINGEDGTKGGDIFAYIANFQTDGRCRRHFRSRGSRGQDPDEGGVEVSSTARDLEAISEESWNEFFSFECRKVPHEEVLWSKDGYTSVMEFPDYKLIKETFGEITYIEFKNTYYRNNIHTVVSDAEIHRSWGAKETPGKGGTGKRPGAPGTGGPGGTFTCSIAELAGYVDLSGGTSGRALGPTPGGPGGTPSPAWWILIESTPNGARHHFETRGQEHIAEVGDPSEAGPAAKAPKGEDGKYVVDSKNQTGWITAINLAVVTQFAKDVCSAGRSDWATAILTPYVKALAGRSMGADIEQPLREARELLRLARANADFFGKPPGWVPTLSLLSSVQIYNSLLPQAMKELYASYYIETIARSKQDKQAALKKFSGLLSESTKTAKGELKDLRKELPEAMDALKKLLAQVDAVQKKVDARRKVLIAKADQEMISGEQKEGIAAAFKITGAVIKAIPLPEPYQTAASGVGSLFDIAGGFVDDGGSDAAFGNLKSQVASFTEQSDGYTDYVNSLEEVSLDVNELENQADKARAVKQGLEGNYGQQAKALEALKAKRKEVHDAQQRALLYGRAKSAKERADIVGRAEKLTTSYQKDVEKLESATNAKVKDYLSAKKDVDKIESEITAKKAAFESEEVEREKIKEANTKKIATRMKQLTNAADSIATIGATINKLAVSRTQLNSKFDAAVAKVAKQDQEFSNLCQQIKFLNGNKETIASRIAQIGADISSRTETISRNLRAQNVIGGQIATKNESLDANALAYIQAIGQEAHLTLTRFLYYTVKAYEYYTVKPWKQSYVTAHKFFENLRRGLEPSQFNFDGITASDEEKTKLEAVLKSPDPRKAGMLSPQEFELLKTVYEKPLLEMGEQLAKELMEGNSSSLKETTSTVTLNAIWLKRLNERMTSEAERNEVSFNLIDLRQIGRTVEKQRIANIRVKGLRVVKLSDQFPDTVKMIFEHVGKSVVRAQGRLFAFNPQGGANANEYAGSGVAFETAAEGGWTESVSQGKTVGKPGELKQANGQEQQNLLSKLLKNNATLSLSHFRPGAFSDFVLRVEVNPLGCKIAFEEITLEVTYEGGISSRNEVLVCVSNNLGMELPIRTDLKDMSGRQGGSGRYIGVFNAQDIDGSEKKAITVEAPAEFGRYKLKHWEINGEAVSNAANSYAVVKDAYIVIHYEDGAKQNAALASGSHA
jgi:hypothetical protein